MASSPTRIRKAEFEESVNKATAVLTCSGNGGDIASPQMETVPDRPA